MSLDDATTAEWDAASAVVQTRRGGIKHDTEKVRYDLIPGEALHEIAEVFTFGAQKYGDRNWEDGMKLSRLFGAFMRHGWAWFRGEDMDPETGKSHLAHAGCCVMMALTLYRRDTSWDDRPIY